MSTLVSLLVRLLMSSGVSRQPWSIAFKEHAHGNPAVKWLNGLNIAHRDISDGNILLARETPSTFTKPKRLEIKLWSSEDQPATLSTSHS
jgi:serine/threonine protein kinase